MAPVIVNEPATDSKVFGYINRALLFFGGASEVIRLWGAAKMLGDERNQWIPDGKGGRLGVNCGNRSLAYAEHYLISRAMVAEGGDPKGRRSRYYKAAALVLGYDAGKIANSLLALLTALPNPGFASPIGPPALALRASLKRIYQGGTCPASKPDPDSTQWSLAGCRDGLVEFKDSDLPITHKSPGVSIRVVL
ncbi:MAG: hypothetical protein LAQ69_12775 [Acidobacteriia bacterium]|nr:hypothetical protein [Terriglobia bacterium]